MRHSPGPLAAGTAGRLARSRRVLLVAAAALVVVGCGQAPVTSPGSETTMPSVPSSTVSTVDVVGGAPRQFRDESWEFPACSDVPKLRAPSEAYRDEPVYVFDESPVDEVAVWARGQPAYAEIWVDRERNGWITVAFTRDAEARQEGLEKEFPHIGAVAVLVDHTRAELEALADRVRSELAPFLDRGAHDIGVDSPKGVAYLNVLVLTEQLRGEIERRFSGEPLCVSGSDPESLPPPGPQPSGGEGWRLLADEVEAGEPRMIGLATDAVSFEGLWAEIGLDAPVPEVDFEEHVVIWFGAAVSGSCPDIRLDDVVVDGSVVYPEIADLNPVFVCTLDAVPHAYVVALERSRLPSGPFVIQLEAELPSYAKPGERLMVDADLSAPGAVADAGAVRPDASLSKPEGSGLFTEPEFPWPYLLDARCGIEWLGVVNAVVWRTDEAMPEEWEESVDEDGDLVVSITMHVEPEPLIEAELNGRTVVYEPSPGQIPGCEQP